MKKENEINKLQVAEFLQNAVKTLKEEAGVEANKFLETNEDKYLNSARRKAKSAKRLAKVADILLATK